jgi:hypothetical protein
VLIARVEEEVGGLGRAGELAGGVDVALAGEDRVVLHAVDLHRDARRPGAEELGRHACVEEQRAARAGAGLGELLRRQDAEREPGVDDLVRERLGGAGATGDDLVGEAELPGVRHPVLDGREGASVEEIRRMDGVPRRPQLVGERVEARRLALGGVVERVLEFLP